MALTAETPRPQAPRCPHCGSYETMDVHWGWNGENEDGSIRPRQVIWECLDCAGFFTTTEQ